MTDVYLLFFTRHSSILALYHPVSHLSVQNLGFDKLFLSYTLCCAEIEADNSY